MPPTHLRIASSTEITKAPFIPHPTAALLAPRFSRFLGHVKILRFRDASGDIRFAADTPDGRLLATGDPFSGLTLTGDRADIACILPPVQPAAILCIGLNYRKHAEETAAPLPDLPVLFMKSPGAATGHGTPIQLPRALRSDQVDYEAELAVVIGRAAKNVSPERALDHVLGYTCANDVSARDWQKNGGAKQWCRSKTFDTFAPLGPALVTPEEIPDPQALRIRSILNGRTMQDSSTADMIFSIAEIIAFLSKSTTLLPGSVILTGTPEGVGMARKPPIWLQPGDTVSIEIEKIGTLTNPVTEELQ